MATLSAYVSSRVVQPAVEINVANQPDAHPLAPGEYTSYELSPGAVQTHRLTLLAGQYVRALVNKGDAHFSSTVYGPDKREVGQYLSKRYGPLLISFVASSAGEYAIEIGSLEKGSSGSRYRLSVEGPRTATERDVKDVLATQLFAEAEKLQAEWEENSFREAIRKYLEASAEWQSVALFREAAEAKENIGDIYFALSEYPHAISSYQEALALSRKVRHTAGEMRALNNIGYVYIATGDYPKALRLFQQVLDLSARQPSHVQDSDLRREKAQVINNLGEVDYYVGKLKEAAAHFNQAQDLWDAAGDRRGLALAQLNLGYTFADSGDLMKALEQFQQAHSLSNLIDDRRGVALAQTAIGTVNSFLGEKQTALNAHTQALYLLRTIGDRQGEAVALNSIGQAYEDLNELQTALDYYFQSLRIAQAGGNTDAEAVTRYYIGRAYRFLGDNERALENYDQSLSLSRKLGKRRVEGYALIDMGTIYAGGGDSAQAMNKFRLVLKLYQEIGDRRGQAHAFNSIGHVHYLAGEKRKALNFFKQALPLSVAAGDRGEEALTLYNIARAERDSGELESAVSDIKASIDIIETLRTKVASQELRVAYFASVHDRYALYTDILMKMHDQYPAKGYAAAALYVSERARARSLLDVLAEGRANIRQGVEAKLLESERYLQRMLAAKAEYQMRLHDSPGNEEETAKIDTELRELDTEYQRVQAAIKEQSPHYADLTQPQTLRADEIAAELQDGSTLLLEYSLGDEGSYLWAVTSTTMSSYRLPERAKIEKAAQQFYALLTARQPQPDETPTSYQSRVNNADARLADQAADLSQMLLGQVASQLGTKRLLIVADGALQYIPFEALPVPAAPGQPAPRAASEDPTNSPEIMPMALRHEIISLPSASTLAALRREKKGLHSAAKTVIVLADPVFERSDPRVTLSSPGDVRDDRQPEVAELRATLRDFNPTAAQPVIPRLPATLQEAQAIMAVISSREGSLLKDFDANRMRVVEGGLDQYRIVHFATHGFINSQHPELSGILLSMVNERGERQNGFLQLHDIYNLELSADLVVLSACNTGLGKEAKGEGLIGLTRGFIYAGAKSVVASFWKVDDQATAELMHHFYQAMLKEGLPPAAALQEAKTAMWKQKRWHHPYYWAAFVLQGEYQQSLDPPAHTNRTAIIIIIFVAIALLTTGFFAIRRRRMK
jgi:tetratricopeptide (TPR) repeat protein